MIIWALRFSSDYHSTRPAIRFLAGVYKKKLGKRSYSVIARFHRKYIDANRPVRDAYESKQAGGTYDVNHEALAKARGDVIRRWGHGILFDIHGQGSEPKAIFCGTQNGKTATHLVSRFGREALIGETSVFGQLAGQGLPVIPVTGSTDREDPRYDGGYIVVTYGSGSGGTLDAIQLELGRELRSTNAITDTADKLANAIAAFATEYLPRAEQSARPQTLGTVDIELSDVGRRILSTKAQQLAIHYGQVPLLVPGNRPDIADYETMATYKTEIAKNGAPKGVIVGTTVIARSQYGRGRVVCFSPHPDMSRLCLV